MSDLRYGIKLKLSRDARFDLAEVMAAIDGGLLRRLIWKVQLESFVIYYESHFARNAEFIAPVGDGWIECGIDRRPWDYEQLVQFAREDHQVIDGLFTGYKTTPKGKKKWLVFKAFDSSFWEVWAGDQAVIEKVSAAFPRDQQEALTVPWGPSENSPAIYRRVFIGIL